MTKHLSRDLEHLKSTLMEIGARVEKAVQKALVAFEQRDADLAKEVIEEDRAIDESEVDVEEQCLKSLALHQPVAMDLRFITSVLKINNDLERMGDCATNIARRTASLAKTPPTKIPDKVAKMAEVSLEMVHESLICLIERDAEAARSLCKKDDVVDHYCYEIIDEVRQQMRNDPEQVDPALDIFLIIRQLERIADLSTNIAEDVVYLVEGEIIRHQGGKTEGN